jgi:uncharacterized protein (TIGR02231 family)
MKKILFACLFLLVQAAQANSLPQTVDHKLNQVQAYLSGARLTHQAKFQLEAGDHLLHLATLAGGIDENSVRLMSSAGLLVGTLNWQQRPVRSLAVPDALKAGIDSLRQLQMQLDALRSNKELWTQEQQLILANKELGGQQGVQVAELQKMADFYRTRLADINQRLLVSQQEERKLLEAIKNKDKDIETRRASLPEFVTDLYLEVNAAKAGNHQLELSYFTYLVNWEPQYELRSDALGASFKCITKAKIYQQTGIDWKGVKVELATQLAANQLQKPVLYPWVLDFYQPQPQPMMKANMAAAPRASRDDMLVPGEPDMQEFMQMAERRDATLMAFYAPKGSFTVRHGESKSLWLEQQELSAQYQHYLAPRQHHEVLLLARLAMGSAVKPLPGQARVYFDNALVNQLWLAFEADSDTLELALGSDRGITVKYEAMQPVSGRKRLGNKQERSYQYVLDVKNNRQQAVQLVVEDQIPITANKEIEITDLQLAGAGHEVEKGMLRWVVELQPGQNRNLRYGFVVRYPANKTVSGL